MNLLRIFRPRRDARAPQAGRHIQAMEPSLEDPPDPSWRMDDELREVDRALATFSAQRTRPRDGAAEIAHDEPLDDGELESMLARWPLRPAPSTEPDAEMALAIHKAVSDLRRMREVMREIERTTAGPVDERGRDAAHGLAARALRKR